MGGAACRPGPAAACRPKELPLNRLIPISLVALAVAASACGGASSNGGAGAGGDRTPAQILRDGARSTKNATSAAFDLTASLDVKGAQGTAASAFANGPVTLHVQGHAGRLDGSSRSGKFDLSFDLKTSGLTMSGRALSPDGRTVYVQLPFALGPGWYETKLPQTSSGQTKAPQGYAGLLRGLDPRTWLDNVSVSHPDGSDRIDADLDIKKAVADVVQTVQRSSAGSELHVGGRDLRMLDRVQKAVKAHGYVAYDSSSHFPSALGGTVDVDLAKITPSAPASSLELTLDATFSDWNQSFDVTAPSDAKPFPHQGLFGSGSPFSAAA